jgi:hypothetical protein
MCRTFSSEPPQKVFLQGAEAGRKNCVEPTPHSMRAGNTHNAHHDTSCNEANHLYQGSVPIKQENKATPADCKESCKTNAQCNFYSWVSGQCQLFTVEPPQKVPFQNAEIGRKNCLEPTLQGKSFILKTIPKCAVFTSEILKYLKQNLHRLCENSNISLVKTAHLGMVFRIKLLPCNVGSKQFFRPISAFFKETFCGGSTVNC